MTLKPVSELVRTATGGECHRTTFRSDGKNPRLMCSMEGEQSSLYTGRCRVVLN